MQIKVRLDRPLDSHSHFSVFVNGALAGKLCFNKSEWEMMIQDKKLEITCIKSISHIYTEKEIDSIKDSAFEWFMAGYGYATDILKNEKIKDLQNDFLNDVFPELIKKILNKEGE